MASNPRTRVPTGLLRGARAGIVTAGIATLLVASLSGCSRGGRSEGAGTDTSTSTSTGASAPRDETTVGQGTSTTTGAPPAPPPSTSSPACSTDAGLAAIGKWPLERRLAQLLFVGIDPSSPADAVALAADPGVGGVFVGGNDTGALTSGKLQGLVTSAGVPVLVAIDEEGGRVQRIDAIDGSWPSARTVAATMTPAQARDLAEERATAMRRLGVTMDFAPDVDVSAQPAGAVIGDRSYSNDPEVVASYARAVSDGLRDGGVIPVLKHFPGHGHAVGDSHEGTSVTPPLASLRGDDLVPYERLLATAPAVMVGHLEVPGLTGGQPASLSPAAVDGLLRRDLGFDGLVVTDELGGMKAVSSRYGTGEAVVRAIVAGGDMALWNGPSRVPRVLAALRGAVADGRLTEARVDRSVLRILLAKHVDPCTA